MAHTRIWESENKSCFYEFNQLNDMILSWEPEYGELLKDDFDKGLGIYSMKYFTPSRFGRNAYSGSDSENSISLLSLRSRCNSQYFTQYENDRVNVYYNYEKKLWENKHQRKLMFAIDNALIAAKVREIGRPVFTRYRWPLSFSLESDTVNKVLKKYGIEINQ